MYTLVSSIGLETYFRVSGLLCIWTRKENKAPFEGGKVKSVIRKSRMSYRIHPAFFDTIFLLGTYWKSKDTFWKTPGWAGERKKNGNGRWEMP